MNLTASPEWPATIESEAALLEVLTRPRPVLVEFIGTVRSPLVLLGAGGKMGPTLAVLARRAAILAGHDLRVIAVSRFTDGATRRWLEEQGIETLACDLLEREVFGSLPDAPNLVYLVGLKFGTQRNPAVTWAVNTLIPAYVAERYRGARMAVLSTGNVYPLVPVASGGANEDYPLTPLGEYANAAVARERLFEYFAGAHGTPLTVLRLNYAIELRYGVLVDIAQKVWAGQPVDVTMGFLNCIWQADANELILRSLGLAECPPRVLNLTGGETLSVRTLAEDLGELAGRAAVISGTESETALLSNTQRLRQLLGGPATPAAQVLRWTADWVRRGGGTLNKPTHFEVRDGRY